MGKIKFQESNISLERGKKGKIAIFMLSGTENYSESLDIAVSQYVGHEHYNQLIDINGDNYGLRVIISGINEMEQVDFDPNIHKL